MPIVKQISSASDIQSLGSILSIWAHPDDETFSCAGIMTMAVSNGQSVACITATRGEAGIQDELRWPAAQLGDIRQEELAEALHILGIHHHHWLDYNDGHCQEADQNQAAKQLATYIDLYKPNTILTFGPDGMTGHPDHKTVSGWVDRSLAYTVEKPVIYHSVQLRGIYEKYLMTADERFDIFFNIDKPPLKEPSDCDICITLPSETCRKKCKALAAMPSQTEGLVNHFGEEILQNVFSSEAFVLASEQAR